MSKRTSTIIVFMVFILYALSCTAAWGKTNSELPGKTPGSFHPVRIAFNPEGNLIISEYKRGLIVTLDRNTLGVIGWFAIDGKPLGVACLNDYILVGNESRNCLEVYKKNGRKLPFYGNSVQKPVDIAVDNGLKRIFVVDGEQKAVKVLSNKGKLLFSIPSSPPHDTILANPTGITLDTIKQEVYVGDYGDQAKSIYARVQIFDYSGNLTGTISGKEGMFGQRFSRPQGLAVDGKGHLLMVDCYAGEIMVFDLLSGVIIKTIGEYGTEPGQLRLPLDIVFDAGTKDIFITNNRSSRIEAFRRIRGL
jgi:DNA-binding beta-propeller fold protein YncE